MEDLEDLQRAFSHLGELIEGRITIRRILPDLLVDLQVYLTLSKLCLRIDSTATTTGDRRLQEWLLMLRVILIPSYHVD